MPETAKSLSPGRKTPKSISVKACVPDTIFGYGTFGVKNVGVKPTKRVTADIVVAVTGRAEHMARLNCLIFVRVEDFLLIVKCDIVKARELIFEFCLSLYH